MSIYNLDKIFHPASVAVIGASPREGTIGAALMECCLAIAKEKSFKSIWGIALAENTQMLALGRGLGFEIQYEPGSGDYKLRLDLSKK